MEHPERCEHEVLAVASVHCIWCGAAIRIGIVTAGGVVWHLACWRKRQALMRRVAEELARCMT